MAHLADRPEELPHEMGDYRNPTVAPGAQIDTSDF